MARSIFLDGTDLERDREALMKFRLTYTGRLLSSKPHKEDELDKRIEHKHDIRRHFHNQLKEVWSHNRFLREIKRAAKPMFDLLPGRAKTVWSEGAGEVHPLPELLGPVFGHSGYNFVPLLCRSFGRRMNCIAPCVFFACAGIPKMRCSQDAT